MDIQDFYEDGYMNLFGTRKRKLLTAEERAWAATFPDSADIDEMKATLKQANEKFKTLPRKTRKQRIMRDALSSYIVKLNDNLKEMQMEVKTAPPEPPAPPTPPTPPTPPPPPPTSTPNTTPPEPTNTSGSGSARGGVTNTGAETAGEEEDNLDKTKAPTTSSDKAPSDPKKLNKNYIYIGVGLLAALGVFMFMKKRKQAQV